MEAGIVTLNAQIFVASNQRFLLAEPIAPGGMGGAYLAWDTRTHQFVALKTPTPGDENALSAFRDREIPALEHLAKTNNPLVPELIETNAMSDPPYAATEFVAGQTLWQALWREVEKDGKKEMEIAPFPEHLTLRVVEQLARGLHDMHEDGVTHNDVKATNIIISESEVIKLVDYGAAVIEDPSLMPGDVPVFGTPEYLAPEIGRRLISPHTTQAIEAELEGELEPPQRATPKRGMSGRGDSAHELSLHEANVLIDTYAVGVVAYQCANGELPPGHFAPASPRDRLSVISFQMFFGVHKLPPPSKMDRLKDPKSRVQEIITKLTDEDPSRRPDLLELAETIRRRLDKGMGTRRRARTLTDDQVETALHQLDNYRSLVETLGESHSASQPPPPRRTVEATQQRTAELDSLD
jgi:serine/threonine protein kinase